MNVAYTESSLLDKDFALRVLLKAERIRTKRRRRLTWAVTCMASVIAISTFLAWQGPPHQQTPNGMLARTSTPDQIDEWTQTLGSSHPPSAMNAFFPDATALARFDAHYTAENTGVVIAGWVTPVNKRWVDITEIKNTTASFQ